MSADEIDYDDLDIVRTWRTFEPDAPGQVRYFCYELAQTDPNMPTDRFFKAVRLIRLTRVPRYLRNTGSKGGEVFSAMRDVLVGLREKRVLFINMIAKSPELPLVFAYGVQATGDTIEEAMAGADDAYSALSVALDGTYQQLEYQPLSLTEGETLARYQQQWGQIAMARGRPMPQGIALGSSGILDGNRTDAENTNNQLEAFIRGMGNRSFMLSMVTAPLTPEAMTSAWRNISKDLSKVRSDQQGSRGVSAGIALPLGTGISMGDGSGTTHGVTGTSGVGSSDGLSASQSAGSSYTHTDGTNAAVSNTQGVSASQSVSDTHAVATAQGQSISATESVSTSDGVSASNSVTAGQSFSEGQSVSQGTNASVGQSLSESQSAGTSQSVSVGQSVSQSQGASMSESNSVNSGQSMSQGNTASANWSQNAGQSVNAGQTQTTGFNQSVAESLQQTWNQSFGENQSLNTGYGQGNSAGIGANMFGFGTNLGENWGSNTSTGFGQNNTTGVGQTGGATNTSGINNSMANNIGQTLSLGESQGGSLANSQTATNSVGQSYGLTHGQSVSQSIGQTAAQSQGISNTLTQAAAMSQSQGVSSAQGVSQSAGMNTGAGQTLGQSQTLAHANALGQGQSLTQSVSDGRTLGTTQGQSATQGLTQGVSSSDARGVSATNTQGASTANSQQQALSDAWMVAASRTATTSGTLGVVPNVGVNVSKQTFNEAKRVVGDILEAQMKRYLDGIEGGGMLYQMFLVCPDRETLVGGSSLLKSAFWGSGGDSQRLPSPFHTTVVEDPEEAGRLLTHAAAFSSYKKREPVTQLIEPYMYSTYVTTGEASVFCHPPTHEALGLMANTDSMPIFAMPANRGDRDMFIGHIVDGERARVSDARFGVDLDELTHILIQGTTGSGKTTTMMRLLEQAVRLRKEVISVPTPQNPVVETKQVSAGVLALDWMQNFRDLANVVPEDRFQLFSVSQPELGEFRFNPLEIPHEKMDPAQWLGAQADQLSASFGLGEFGRSLLSEALDELYRANRLVDYELRPAKLAADGSGVIESPAIILPAVDESELPADAVTTNVYGERVADVYSYPKLSRLVGLPDVATIIARKIGEGATQEAGRLQGTDIRNRLQSVWRRLQYYAPGGPGYRMVAADPSLSVRECMGVTDLIDPDRGLVTVIETDGLDLENRRVILGSVMLAVYRYGLHGGKGCFDHNGKGPGSFVVLEEAHELFGDATDGEDAASATMRANLYESLFRRARATGLRLVAMTQNCGHVPSAITSMTTTVFTHRTYDDKDRSRIFDLINYQNTALGGQIREFRYLGEMPRGYCIARLDAQDSYLESAPVQILVDPPGLPPVSDAQLAQLAQRRT